MDFINFIALAFKLLRGWLFKSKHIQNKVMPLCFPCSDNLDPRVKLEGITCHPNLIPALRLCLIKSVSLTPGGIQTGELVLGTLEFHFLFILLINQNCFQIFSYCLN